MEERKFGSILTERRRRLGISIDQAVSATKLRPQVIEAFERSDFASLPPRGYAQGMLSSYARFLRLDPKEVLSLYFDQLYTFERERELSLKSERSSIRSSSWDDISKRRTGRSDYARPYGAHDEETHVTYMQHAQRTPYGMRSEDRSYGNVYSRYNSQSRASGPVGQPSSTRRGIHARRDPYTGSQGYYPGAYEEGAERPYRQDTAYLDSQMPRAYQPSKQRLAPSYEAYDEYDPQAKRSSRRARGQQALGSSQGVMARASQMLDTLPVNRNYLILGASIVLLIILLLLVFSIKSCVSKPADSNKDSDRAVTPVTVITPAATPTLEQPAQTLEPGALQSQNGENLAPQKDILTLSLPEGKSAYIEVVVDDKPVVHATLSGPLTESYSLNKSVKVTTTMPRSVSLKLNGEKVLFKNSGSTGVYNYIVPEQKEQPAAGATSDTQDFAQGNKTNTTDTKERESN